jgi:hypothetical protein
VAEENPQASPSEIAPGETKVGSVTKKSPRISSEPFPGPPRHHSLKILTREETNGLVAVNWRLVSAKADDSRLIILIPDAGSVAADTTPAIDIVGVYVDETDYEVALTVYKKSKVTGFFLMPRITTTAAVELSQPLGLRRILGEAEYPDDDYEDQ